MRNPSEHDTMKWYMEKAITYLKIIVTFIIFPLLLIFVGFTHVYPLFEGEFTQHYGSIEISYIQMAKFIEASLPGFSWQPRWYLGYPMWLLYTPLVPFFEVVMHTVAGWSFSHGYRVLTAFSYVGVLITFYFFVRELFKNTASGLVSALIYGIVPSIMSFLFIEVANDRFAAEIVEPRRFTILTRWGEGPHIVALLFLPIAALGWLMYLRNGRKRGLLLGSVFTAITALTNSIGVWGLGLLVFALLVGEFAEKTNDWHVVVKRMLILGLTSIGLAAFWFNPLFVGNFFAEGGNALGFWKNQFPWGWLVLGIIFVIYFYIAKNVFARFKGVTASVTFFLLTFGLVYTYYASGSEKLELVPQVLRLTAEVDLGFAMLISAVISIVGHFLVKKNIRWYQLSMGVISLVSIAILFPRQSQLMNDLPEHTRASKDSKGLESRVEYEMSQLVASRIEDDERVFLPGNYAFYFNYFSDIPQLRGALYQSEIHPWPEHIYYQVTTGKNADITLAWMKIANVGWFILNGPRNVYQDFEVGVEKFDTIFTQVDEKEGDRLYQVPLKNTSLAKVVPSSIKKIKTPKNAIDKEPIFEYAETLEASDTELEISEKKNGIYEITGETNEDELILVQLAYVPGWRARDVHGKKLTIEKDPLGFVLIKPDVSGEQKIILSYHTPIHVWSGWIVTLITIISLIALIFKKDRNKILPVTSSN